MVGLRKPPPIFENYHFRYQIPMRSQHFYQTKKESRNGNAPVLKHSPGGIFTIKSNAKLVVLRDALIPNNSSNEAFCQRARPSNLSLISIFMLNHNRELIDGDLGCSWIFENPKVLMILPVLHLQWLMEKDSQNCGKESCESNSCFFYSGGIHCYF